MRRYTLPAADCSQPEEPGTTRSEVASMILFTLRCTRGHQFERWFRDDDGFEAQQKAGAIACPECGDTKVEKAVMAPRLGKSLRRIGVGFGVTDDSGGVA
jgi:hypothetical protein